MTLSAGTRLGPYEITGPLGSGGMGEVYRARDTRLGRDVALKVLPAEVADDASRRQRFEHEARAVAALNHPNIVAIHDIGAENGVLYIISELVDGEPLRGARFGLRKVLDIAVQIANGLAAAHDAAIVHRDLKPDNILLTRDGRVKILDFGLAKVTAAHAAAAAETLTIRTEPGVVMGTVGYMSPEQVRGCAADYRSDIFSFGLILYELLAGRRAFSGDTAVETMTAILKHDAPDLPETVPTGVRQIVARCLEKDPGNRFQSAKDLAFALSQTGTQTGTAPVLARRTPWLRRGVLALAVVAAAALAVVAGHFLWQTPAPSWSGTLLPGPEIAMTPRISPDGHMLALLAMEGNLTQVAVMKPESGNWAILTHNRERGWVNKTSWSPDGTRIYYDRTTGAPNGVYSVPLLGGPEQLVVEDAMCPEALPDGTLLAVRLNAEREPQVFRVWPETGRMQGLPMKVGLSSPSVRVFPGGREAAVIGTLMGKGQPTGKHLYVIDLASARVRRVATGGAYALAVTRDGRHILTSDNFRMAATATVGRSPAHTLFPSTSYIWSADAGPDGSIYVDQVDRPVDLVRFPSAGGQVRKLATIEKGGSGAVILLSDGRAVWAQEAGGRVRLMAVETGKDAVPIVNTAEDTAPPVTLAGPGEFAFLIGPEPRRTIAWASIATGRVSRRIPFDKGPIQDMASAPDGKTLYCVVASSLGAGGSIWAVPVAGGEPVKIRAGDSVAVDPAGRYLLVLVVETGSTRLVRMPLDGGAEQEITLSGPYRLVSLGAAPISKDGRLLAMVCGSDSWFCGPGMVDLSTGQVTRIPADYRADFIGPSWTPDGQVIAAAWGLRSTLWKFTPEGR